MKTGVLTSDPSKIEVTGARLAIATAVAALLLLFSLHVLSPEFDPSWRMVSEYALGHYGWVLSLIVLSNCLWVFVAAWQAMKLAGQRS
jgi:hypothetical protein